MGIFSRKNTKSSNHSGKKSPSISSDHIQSPRASRPPAGASFGSLPSISAPKAPDPSVDPAAYLRSIFAVRDRCSIVAQKARQNQLKHFDVDLTKWRDTAHYVVSIIKRDYAPNYHSIPAHGRWQHFEAGGRPRVDQLLATWTSQIDTQERCRRLIDLFVVSVLLDAGAGAKWQYKSKESGKIYKRSEGLAVASLEMFKSGAFSSNPAAPHQVDGKALKAMTVEVLAKGLQHSEHNPLAGLEGRAGLMARLGDALSNQLYFGSSQRPGHLLDYLLSHHTTLASSVPIVSLPTLWDVLMDGLSPIWPSTRTQIHGTPLGDAWACSSMPSSPQSQTWENIVPFHKLTQWMAYSLMTPMSKLLHIHFAHADLLTGLPEYRNGGLFIDTGLLTLKDEDRERGLKAYKDNAMIKGQPNMEVVPLFTADDDVIVEWRAVTVGFLDWLLEEVNAQLGLFARDGLTLAQLLEAGSWKGGRELAEVSRPNTKEPPIMIVSDGTVF